MTRRQTYIYKVFQRRLISLLPQYLRLSLMILHPLCEITSPIAHSDRIVVSVFKGTKTVRQSSMASLCYRAERTLLKCQATSESGQAPATIRYDPCRPAPGLQSLPTSLTSRRIQ